MRLPLESWTAFFTKLGFKKRQGKKAKRLQPRRLQIETLEARQLLATDLTFNYSEPANEGGAAGFVEFARYDTVGTLDVNYEFEWPAQPTSGMAESGDVPAPHSGTVTFADGANTVLINVSAVDDSIPEPEETVIVKLLAESGSHTGATGSTTITISDDDPLLLEVDIDADSNNDGYIDSNNEPDGSDDPVEADPESHGHVILVHETETGALTSSRSEVQLFANSPNYSGDWTVTLSIDNPDSVRIWKDYYGSETNDEITLADGEIAWAHDEMPWSIWVEGVAEDVVSFTLTDEVLDENGDPLGSQSDTLLITLGRGVRASTEEIIAVNDNNDDNDRIGTE